jgi:hypothetical protein
MARTIMFLTVVTVVGFIERQCSAASLGLESLMRSKHASR